jgi:hypothetical protein
MTWKEVIQIQGILVRKIYNKLISYIPWICVCFAIDGVIILIDTALTNGYLPPYTIVSYCLWCFQRYSILFIPLLLYIGYQHKDKLSSNKLNIISVISFILIIITLEIIAYVFFYNKYPNSSIINDYLSINYQILQWGSLMIITFIIFLKSKFSIIFSFALCYLMFYVADIYFELPKTFGSFIIGAVANNSPFFHWFPNLTGFILLMICLITVLYKVNIKFTIKNFIVLCCSFIPLLFSWIYFYPFWSIQNATIYISKIKAIEPIDRLFAFPFIIVLSLYIYKSRIT